MKVFVADFNRACAANVWLSACLRGAFARAGAQEAARWSEADLVVLNSCPAAAAADKVIPSFRRLKGAAVPGVAEVGCLLARSAAPAESRCLRLPLAALLEDPAAAGKALGLPSRLELCGWEAALEGPELSFIEIARAERSLDQAAILRAARKAAQSGRRRLVLAADAPGKWGQDLARPSGLPALVKALRAALPGCRWILPPTAAEDLERHLPGLAAGLGDFDAVCASVTGPLSNARERLPRLAASIKAAGMRGRLMAEWVVGRPGEPFSEFLDSVYAAMSFDAVAFHIHDPRRHPGSGQALDAAEIALRARVLRSLSARYPFRDDLPGPEGAAEEGLVRGSLLELAKASACADGLWTCLGPHGGQWRGGLRR